MASVLPPEDPSRASTPGTTLEEEVAESLDVEDPALLPFLPALLQDLESLGSSPGDVVEVLREAGLAPGSRVLDLGCGKGATARAVARELGCHVVGADGFAPFVAEAERAAAAEGLSDRCHFRHADLRAVVSEGTAYDGVLLISVGPVFGDHSATVRALRGCTRPGGFMVIEDMYLAPGAAGQVPEYAQYAEHEETLRRLTAHGDRLLLERTSSPRELLELNQRNTEAIARRAAELARAHPEAASVLEGFVASQREECERLETQTVNALWLLERAHGP
jgi:2-polyprenyl-3-methyl-5-hydroxy-6-metoxy-1,4-benzoquinol methylase